MHNKNYYKLILTAATVAFTLFIFSNSLQVGEQSGRQSQLVMQIFNDFFGNIGMNITFTEHFIRKLAHFTEYFILGCLLTATFTAYFESALKYLSVQMFLMLFIPVTDEFIQTFTQQRNGNVRDVLLDFCGAVIGAVICCLIIFFINSLKRRRTNKV